MSYNEIDKYAITISDLSKKYTIIHKTDKNKKIEDSSFYALKNINLKIIKGESVGLIGENGSGKSTLLKVLSQITVPTSGTAVINGKIASVLEIGMGFHPELSGRENIYLSGALLGLRKKQIKLLYDDIVAFSEIGNYIDSPVKHYSSGMYLRLAFSVVAHLDVDILMFDEVLSVGDFGFQRKCIAKIQEMLHQNKTVVFVSHSMNEIIKLCERSILIDKGEIVAVGDSTEVIQKFIKRTILKKNSTVKFQNKDSFKKHQEEVLFSNQYFELKSAKISSFQNPDLEIFKNDEELEINIVYRVLDDNIVVIPGFSVFYIHEMLMSNHYADKAKSMDEIKAISDKKDVVISAFIPPNILNDKEYVLEVYFNVINSKDEIERFVATNLFFKIEKRQKEYWESFAKESEAILKPLIRWEIK